MSEKRETGTIQETLDTFRGIAEQRSLLDTDVSVFVKPLTPEEAIGTPERRDFPIIIGKERVVEANVQGSLGHAYTDSPKAFAGTIRDVLSLDLSTNQNRAIYVATLNAVLGQLNMVERTVHCKDEEPEACAVEIAESLFRKYGPVNVGLIGLNPAIAQRLAETFAPEHVRITDLCKDNIGKVRFGVEIWDGATRTEELIDASDVVLLTGTTLVNDTFAGIRSRIHAQGKQYAVYGVTAAGAAQLFGVERICPRGRSGTTSCACS